MIDGLEHQKGERSKICFSLGAQKLKIGQNEKSGL